MTWGPDNVRKWSTLALLAIIGTALTAANDTGFVATISQKGLDFACKQGVVELQKELQTLSVPDFSGVFKIRHLGRGSYQFYSMTVDWFYIPNPEIKMLPGDGLQLSIKDASIKIRGKWKTRKNFLKASGNFNLSIQGVSISADLMLSSDPSGHIAVTCSNCDSHIDSVRIKTSGSMLGWVIQLFHKKIETSLKNIIYKKVEARKRIWAANQGPAISGRYSLIHAASLRLLIEELRPFTFVICKIVKNSVFSKLQPYVKTLPVIARVDDKISIDYSLVAPLTTTEEFLEGELRGEFFCPGHRSPLHINPQIMKFVPSSDHMVSMAISDYFFNTAGHAFQESGTLNIILRDEMLSKGARFHLNTDFIGTFLPKVAKKFPGMGVKLLVSVPMSAHLNIHLLNLSLNPQLETKAFVVLPNTSLVPIFLLGMKTKASLEVDAEENRLVGKIKLGRLSLELKQSNFGLFQVELLEDVMNYLISTIVVPKMNERLHRGFPLPLPDGIQLISVDFHSYENFLLLEADLYRN